MDADGGTMTSYHSSTTFVESSPGAPSLSRPIFISVHQPAPSRCPANPARLRGAGWSGGLAGPRSSAVSSELFRLRRRANLGVAKAVIISISALLWVGSAYAGNSISWEDCIKEAASNNPELIASRERLNQTRLSRVSTRSGLLPQVNASLSTDRSKSSGSDTSASYGYSVRGQQLLFDGMKSFNELSAASANIASAECSYQATSADIRLKLRTAYIQLLRSQELVKIAQDIAKRRKQNAEMVRLRYEAGREHRGSLLSAQADSARAELESVQAGRSLTIAQRQLARELGRTETAPVSAEGLISAPDISGSDTNLTAIAAQTPSVREYAARRLAAGYNVKSAKADFYPQVNADASLGRSSSTWPPEENHWSAGVSLSLPLFDGGNRRARLASAKSAYRQTEADERSIRTGELVSLESTFIQLQNAVDSVAVQKKFLEATEERSTISQAQYSSGLTSFDAWTIIEDSVVNARKSFLDTKANAMIAEANWMSVKGVTLDEN